MATQNKTYPMSDHDLLFVDRSEATYVLKLRDMPDEQRPRERMLELGPAALSMSELLAILWGVGSRREDALAMARRTLKEYGDKAIGNELDPRRLSQTADIPLNKACQLVASFELGRRFYATRSGRPVQVRNAKQAYQYVKNIGPSQKEQLRGLYLNSRYQLVHDEIISVGSLTANIVHPREVFQPALENSAVAIILAHNHPSGRLEPSMADINITEQLLAAAEILGIELLDHLIVGQNNFVSVMECIKYER